MRKNTLLFLMIFTLAELQAQDYLISFGGSGVSATVDSVFVENLTQGTSLVMGTGDQLHLLGALSVANPGSAGDGKSLLVYPNPSSGEVNLTFEATSGGKTTIELFDVKGRQVASRQAFLSAGRQTLVICGLNSGIYTVLINSETYRYSGKIISHSSSLKQPWINLCRPSPGQTDPEHAKNTEAVVRMQYTTGDLLKFTGKSGICATVVMDVPATSKTITFAFTYCTDYDNNNYTTVQIGAQTWMAENLKSTHYPDGTTADYFDYDHDPNNSSIYGRLYAWSPAMNGAASSNTNPSNVQGVCPNGWHLPSKSEWQLLAGYLGGSDIAGGKLKETGNAHWISPNAGATDEVGFTALPAGMWAFWDEFQWLGDHGAFSTSTGNLPMVEVTTIMLQTSNGVLTVGTFHPDDAVSVRCVKN
jgi:uncharacterized protein (TIGR02145 family)